MSPKLKTWAVYIVRCSNGALYTGITNRLKGRIADHNSGKGARYTAAFGPVELVWHKKSETRSSASKLEARIKQMRRREKEELALVQKKLHTTPGSRLFLTGKR